MELASPLSDRLSNTRTAKQACQIHFSDLLRLEAPRPEPLLAHGVVQPVHVDLERRPAAAVSARAAGQPPGGLVLLLGLGQLPHEVQAGAEVHPRRGVLRPQRHRAPVELFGALVVAGLPESESERVSVENYDVFSLCSH